MELSDEEKLELGLESIKSFLEQFPSDDNAKILIDVMLTEILLYSNNENLYLSS